MFRHRRQRRLWAAQMLLVWLFGIVVGVAHACVAPAPGSAVTGHSQSVAPSGSHHCDVIALSTDRSEGVRADLDTDHDRSSGKSNCQDVCEKSTISIPPQKLGLDGSSDLSLLLPGIRAVAWSRPREPAATRGELSRNDCGTATAITIAFLRLAL